VHIMKTRSKILLAFAVTATMSIGAFAAFSPSGTARSLTSDPGKLKKTKTCVEKALGVKIGDDEPVGQEHSAVVISCLRGAGLDGEASNYEAALANPQAQKGRKSGPTVCVEKAGFAVTDPRNPVVAAADVALDRRAAFVDMWIKCNGINGSSAAELRSMMMSADKASADMQRAMDAAHPEEGNG
jgi:hypothetical protein